MMNEVAHNSFNDSSKYVYHYSLVMACLCMSNVEAWTLFDDIKEIGIYLLRLPSV